jgi:hypothetical protein
VHADEDRRKARGVGFVLVALLLLIAVALSFFGYRRISRSYRVTAYLEVQLTPTTLQAITDAQRACIDLLRSPAVINDVLDYPPGAGARQLPTIARQSNPAAWLASRLQISFAADLPVLEITLSGRDIVGDSWGDDGQVLYRVLDSFQRAILNLPPTISAKLGGTPTVKVIQKPVVVRR